MADENFILTLEGKLDEKKTEENVKSVLKKINQTINSDLKTGIKIFDKEQLDKDGKIFIDGLTDIKKKIADALKVNEGDVSIATIFDDKGAIEAFTAKVNTLSEAFSKLNLVRVNFTDGGQGFVATNASQGVTQLNTQVTQLNQNMQNVQTAPMSNNLNNLSSNINQTTDSLGKLATEVRNVEGISTGLGLGNLFKDNKGVFNSIDEFRNKYRQLIGDMNGFSDAVININDKGNNAGFTATIVSATGAVENLNFALNKAGQYVYQGSTLKDNVFTQQAQSILKAEKALDSFNRKLNDGVSYKFVSQDTLDRVENLRVLLANLRMNVGNNNTTAMDKMNADLQQIIELANEYDRTQKKMKAETDKYTASVNKQNLELEKSRVYLENVSNTKLNANNAAFVGNSDKLADVNKQFADLVAYRKQLATKNAWGQILDQRELDSLTIKTHELNKALDDARRTSGQSFDRSESAQKLATGIATLTSRLQAQIPMWEKMGVYTGDFKTKVETVFTSLTNAQNSVDLSNINKQITQLGNNARQLSREAKNALGIEQLAQKTALFKQQIDIFEQNNPRAAAIYATQFDKLKQSLSSVTDGNQLKRLQNDFKQLQLASKQLGVEGKTMGQRLSEAFRKVLTLGGITSLMMYTTKAIRDVIQNVKDLDKAMVLLQRVTNESDATYKQMFNNAVKNAKELNTTVLDLIQSTAELSKLGFDPKTAETLSQIINMFNRVGDVGDINKSTEYMVSIINGFKDLSADDAMGIVDVLDNINNKYSISAEGISEALKRSAASLSEANNTLEESVALITASNSVVKLCHLITVI